MQPQASRVTVVVPLLLSIVAACGASSAQSSSEADSRSATPSSTARPPTASATGSASAEPPKDAGALSGGVRIKKRGTRVGDKVKRTQIAEGSLVNDSPNGKPNKVEFVEGTEKVAECLELTDDGCIQWKVTYTVARRVERQDGRRIDHREPVVGKTYIVTRKTHTPSVTLEDGSVPGKAELSFVRREFSGSVSDAPTGAVPATVQVGDGLESLAGALSKNHSTRPGDSTFELRVREFVTVDGKELALIALSGRMRGSFDDGGDFEFGVTGTLSLAMDGGAITSLEWSGPYSVSDPESGTRFTGVLRQTMTNEFDWMGLD